MVLLEQLQALSKHTMWAVGHFAYAALGLALDFGALAVTVQEPK